MYFDLSLIWDLENNREVKTITAVHQFSTPETYVTLGIKVNVPDKS